MLPEDSAADADGFRGSSCPSTENVRKIRTWGVGPYVRKKKVSFESLSTVESFFFPACFRFVFLIAVGRIEDRACSLFLSLSTSLVSRLSRPSHILRVCNLFFFSFAMHIDIYPRVHLYCMVMVEGIFRFVGWMVFLN